MNKEEMTLEKAEKIVDNMYQNRWEECSVDEGNTIHLANLDSLQYSELEIASVILLRTETRFKKENTNLKQALNEIREYVNTSRFSSQFENNGNEENVRLNILQIIDKVGGNEK